MQAISALHLCFLLLLLISGWAEERGSSAASLPPSVSLRGAGSLICDRLFRSLHLAFEQHTLMSMEEALATNATLPPFESVSIAYDTRGSDSAKLALLAGASPYDFVGQDSPLSSEDLHAYPDALLLPLAASAIAPIYNVRGLSAPLILSREVLAKIFLGDIEWWNDGAIALLNPAASLPAEKIKVVVPMEPAGTTKIFTSNLASFYGAFASRVGSAEELPDWCEGVTTGVDNSTIHFGFNRHICQKAGGSWEHYRAHGVEGIEIAVKILDFSISFMALSEANGRGLAAAHLYNRQNVLVQPNSTSLQYSLLRTEAMYAGVSSNSSLEDILLDTEATLGWPIAGFSYFLLRRLTHTQGCLARAALLTYLKWFYESDAVATQVESAGFVPFSRFTRLMISNLLTKAILCVPACDGSSAKPCDCRADPTRCMAPDVSQQRAQSTLAISYPASIEELAQKLFSIYGQKLLTDVPAFEHRPRSLNISTLFVVRAWDELQSDATLTAMVMPSNVLQLQLQTAAQSQQEAAAAAINSIVVVPFLGVPLGLVYNLGNAVTDLTLTIQVVGKILSGQIRKWSHPEIKELNPGSPLPDVTIAVLWNAEEDLLIPAFAASWLSAVDSDTANKLSTFSQLSKLTDAGVSAYRAASQDELVSFVTGIEGSFGLIMSSGGRTARTANLRLSDGSVVGLDAANIQQCYRLAAHSSSYRVGRYISSLVTASSAAEQATSCWPLILGMDLITRREFPAGQSSKALAMAQLMDWLVNDPMLTRIGAATGVATVFEGTVNSSSRIIREIRHNGFSVLDPEKPCSRADMAFNLSACHSATGTMTASFYWKDGDERWCLGGESLPEAVEVDCDHVMPSSTSGIFLIVFSLLGMIVVVGVTVWTVINRTRRIIIISQKLFLFIFLCGGIALNLTAMTLIGENAEVLCGLRPTLISLSFSTMFAPLLMKLKRVDRLFNNPKLRKVKISNLQVVRESLSIILVDVLLLILWMALDNSQLETVAEAVNGVGNVDRRMCSFGSRGYFTAVIVWKFIILLIGVILSVKTWNVDSEYAEARHLAFALYNAFLMGGLTLTLVLLMDISYQLAVFLAGLTFIMISTISVAAVMGPKIYHVFKFPQSELSKKTSAEVAAATAGGGGGGAKNNSVVPSPS